MDFELPRDLEVMHQPARLRIMTILYRERDIGFSALRASLDLTAGNLASHADRLVGQGWVDHRRTFGKTGLESRFRLTPAGAAAFEQYLSVLRSYLSKLG